MNAKKIRKCVIPAAGMGTRFLPATKALPKEMFPIVDKPVMQYLVEEAIEAGCEDIIIVTGRSKRAIEDHFDSNPELETRLLQNEKTEALRTVQHLNTMANIVYVRQPYPKGDGDALLRTRNLIGDEPFLVLFGDDIIDHETSAAQQLIQTYQKLPAPIIATVPVSSAEVSSYGILEGEQDGDMTRVTRFLEKPDPSDTSSRTGVIGKYVLTPDIFDALEASQKNTQDSELRLADALAYLRQSREIYGLEVQGTRYDTGTKLGYLKACIAYGLKDPDIKDDILSTLQTLGQK